MEKHIVSFSGGKDSTTMLLMMIEKDMKIDEIIFCDTTKEFPQMYEHISKLETYINRPIKTLKPEHDFNYYMFDHIKTKGKNKGERGYGWCTGNNKWCTYILKKQVIDRYLRKYKQEGIDVIEYHGIAYDEPKRIEKNQEKNIKYPLYEWKIIEKEALNYCYNKGFNWACLYDYFERVSCWCCPNSNLKELRNLYFHFPKLWIELRDMDKRSNNQFRLDYTLDELELRFEYSNKLAEYIENHNINIKDKNVNQLLYNVLNQWKIQTRDKVIRAIIKDSKNIIKTK